MNISLLIYTILIGTATKLAQQHLIYAIVALAFMIPAEKLLRKFFGFDNAGTLSAAGSFAGGALFSTMISKLSKGKSGGGSNTSEREGQRQIRKANSGGGGVDADDRLRIQEYQGQSGVANPNSDRSVNVTYRNSRFARKQWRRTKW